jgi:Tol biopolymer transport system component
VGDDPSLSADGTKVAFVDGPSQGDAPTQVRLADLGPTVQRPTWPGDFTLISATHQGDPGDGDSFSPAVDADGRAIAFDSAAHDLLRNDGNGHIDAFVSRSGVITRASVNNKGQAGTDDSAAGALACIDLTADGGIVAFESLAPNLVPNDTNGSFDVFVRVG